MEIKLTHELEAYVLDRVKSGEYASVEDVVAEALQQHRVDDPIPDDIVRELTAADADIDAGNYIEFEEFAAALRKKYGP